jgi:nucleotide-binding universal stress UspA family protein
VGKEEMYMGVGFQSILFPVDFSPMSQITAPYVLGLTQFTGASVTLLHVLPWLSGWSRATELRPAVSGDEALRHLHNRQMIALEMFRARHFSDSRCFRLVKEGAVAEAIAQTAKEIRADLIMIPTHGLGPSSRFLIGSTTAKVLRDAPCAVWTTPHVDALPSFTGFRHILCTIDHDEVPPDFLKEAVRLASYFGSKLSFVTAIPGADGGMGEQRIIRSLDKEYPQAGLHNPLDCETDCTVYLERGSIGAAVRRLVENQAVDLVITNRGDLQDPSGKLRTHVYDIVLQSPCPVLSLCLSAKHGYEATEYASIQKA